MENSFILYKVIRTYNQGILHKGCMMDLQRVKELKKNIFYLDKNKEAIVQGWTSNEEVKDILTKYDVEIKMFQTTYAHPVLNYFIAVVNEDQKIGNCPVIAKLLEYLQQKHVTSSELFIICINFRKSIIKKLFQLNLMNEALYESVSYIFDENFRGVLQAFNDTIAKAKEESKKNYELTLRDHLTALFNRKMFDELLRLQIRNVHRDKVAFSIIFYDIDHFKDINDSYGHEVGDNVLIRLSAIVQGALRASDTLARWGGEEFIVLLQNTKLDSAQNKAQKIRKLIESYDFTEVGNITCSFGVTQYKEGDDSSSLFNKVDEALYLSKSNGRNQVSSIY